MLAVVNALLRHRRSLFTAAVGLSLFTVGLTLMRPREFTARASFTPSESGAVSGRLLGIAAQFGIPIGTTAAAATPAFYAELLHSPELLRKVALSVYSLETAPRGWFGLTRAVGTDSTLIGLLGVSGETFDRRRERTVRELSEIMPVAFDRQTGIVTLAVTTHSPELSEQIARRALALVDEFNVSVRQTQAAAERTFVEGRLAEARSALRGAEDALEAFENRNRSVQSPDLVREMERLRREVALQQELFVTLAQAYEQARIEEVRNTPVVTVLERPIRPVPDSRRLVVRGVGALMVGLLLAAFVALLRDFVLGARGAAAEEADEYRSLMREARNDLAAMLRPLRSRRASGVAGRG